MTLPPELEKIAKEMAENLCPSDKVAFSAGFRACYEHLLTMGPEFDGREARNVKMGTSGALTIAVDAFEAGARYQHSLMSAQLAARDIRIRELEAMLDVSEREFAAYRKLKGEG